MPSSIGEIASGIIQVRERSKQAERDLVQKAGGPVAWLRRRAPELLPLYPAGPSPSEFFAESLDGWLDGAVRARECAKCPPYGGACDGTQNAWPDGQVIVADAERGISGAPCPKWAKWSTWKLLGAANVPEALREIQAVSELDCKNQEGLALTLDGARTWGAQHWYLVTGGDARRHRRALVALLVELGVVIHKKSFWYDYSARIQVGLRDHMNDEDSLDLRHKLRTVPVLAIDHVNPTGWKPWFTEAMDEILYARAGKVTILGSSRSVLALQEALPLSGDVIAEAQLVEIG